MAYEVGRTPSTWAAKPPRERRVVHVLRRWRRAHAGAGFADTLDELRREGWIVLHDVEQRGEGSIDHVASGPGGIYLVETKARAYQDAQLTKARRQAAKLHADVGVWVTPVICLHERRGKPFKTQGVWIVPRAELLAWLRVQRNPPVPFEQLAQLADRVA